MVFIIDDIAEDSVIGGILASIAAYVFRGAVAAAPVVEESLPILTETIQQTVDPTHVELIVDFLEEDGIKAVQAINQGLSLSTDYLPAYAEEGFYNISKEVFDSIPEMQNIPDKQGMVQNIAIIAKKLAQKIPTSVSGFNQLLKDIVIAAHNNPKEAIATATAVGGLALGGLTLANEFRKIYQNSKRLPADVRQISGDVRQTVDDVDKFVKDTGIGVDEI